MDRQWILVALVPTLFAIGIVAFFVLLPSELVTLTNLISYVSSLSTTVMVLVYIFTMSRQLDTMRHQLEEMQYSRSVQIQPLPYLEKPKANLELPRYYVGPETDFMKMDLMCMLKISFSISNIGNGPAIAVDFIPFVTSGPRSGEASILINETISRRIDCVSLRERDSQAMEFYFNDDDHKVIEIIVKDGRLGFCVVMTYKNSLGMPFKEQTAFWLMVKSEKDMKTLESCLKAVKTAEIDFARQIKEYENMRSAGRKDEARKILHETNAKLKKALKRAKGISLSVESAWGSFDVGAISESDYQKLLATKAELEQSEIEIIHGCWEKHK